MEDKYLLGLSMIVKNEHHVIERVLNSVSSHINYWVIVDTGSTDGTQDIIKSFFDKKSIPGEIIEIEWKDFSTSRNVALKAVEEKCKWGFWIDADEEFITAPTFSMKNVLESEENFDTLSINTKYNGVEYTRKSIWRCDRGFFWNGPIHEILSSDKEGPGGMLPESYVIVRAEGSSWTNITEKYAEHAKILEAYTSTNDDPRWIFYTAQSYRDCGNYEKSIEWYKKRASINNGFYEEIYISRLMIARLSELINAPKKDILAAYNEAHSTDTLRGESMKGLIQYLQRINDWELAYIYSAYALRYNLKNPYPSRILFLDNALYQYQLLELHSLSCYYTKRMEEGSIAYWTMRMQLPADIAKPQLDIIMNNEKYFMRRELISKPQSLQKKHVQSVHNKSKSKRKR